MRVKGDTAPGAYSIHDHTTKAGYAVLVLCENAEEYTENETHGWQYDEYKMVIPARANLAADVETNYAARMLKAKNAEYEAMAETVRSIRNKLLEDSDTVMLLDRMGLTLPETITATTLLTAVNGMFKGLRATLDGEWAAYRQALRDITAQPGFPYKVAWPQMPLDSVE